MNIDEAAFCLIDKNQICLKTCVKMLSTLHHLNVSLTHFTLIVVAFANLTFWKFKIKKQTRIGSWIIFLTTQIKKL